MLHIHTLECLESANMHEESRDFVVRAELTIAAVSVHRENHQTVGIKYYKIELCFVIVQAEKEDVRLRGITRFTFLEYIARTAVSRYKKTHPSGGRRWC